MMWRLFSSDGTVKDYEIFGIPFLTVTDKIFSRIRNLTYRYMPNHSSLFPKETQQYDTWLLRELINNSIAHANHQLGGRIYINEEDDCISVVNPGDFLPKNVETVLQKTYNPPFYRNQLLADAMVKFYMIDTATSGIKKIYRIQKEKYFPMPDYDLTTANQVSVKVYGKILDDRYTYILFEHPELDLETIFLLDQVQKGHGQNLSKDAVALLRKYHLVEGRTSSLYLSAEVAQTIDDEAAYIRNKAFDDRYYRDLIVQYIKQYGSATRTQIRDLLIGKLPDSLNDNQKERKVGNLLTSLRKQGIISVTDRKGRKSIWILNAK